MPPTHRSHRVASSTAPGSQRNDRQQARAPRRRSRSTRGESSQTATSAEVITTVAPAVSLPTPTARQAALPEDLISTLVSSVTTAVTQHLSALLPSLSAAPSTNSQCSSTTYLVVQSVSSDHAATLVQDALGEYTQLFQVSHVHLILLSNCLLNHFIPLVCLLMRGYQRK